jgi:hypothetical protein
MKSSISWDITQCSPLSVNRRYGVTCSALLATCFRLVSCLAYSSTLKMDATCSSKTSVDFQRTTRCYISENKTLHKGHCSLIMSLLTFLCILLDHSGHHFSETLYPRNTVLLRASYSFAVIFNPVLIYGNFNYNFSPLRRKKRNCMLFIGKKVKLSL